MKDYSVTIEDHVVVFMDIHDYSSVVNTVGKNKHGGFMQEVYEKLGDIVVEYGGEIIKYMGDAILCIFPPCSENEVIKCSLELRRAFSNIIRERDISDDTELEIGITSGEVERGTFGHKSLMQKDIFGEEVNRAFVIGHHRGIAMTGEVHDRIKMNYKTSKLSGYKAKWEGEPMEVWEIIE